MIRAQRLGHATIETRDFQKSLDYFIDVNGLVDADSNGRRAHLASKIGQLTVTLESSTRADCTRMSFEVAPESDFTAMRAFLNSEGVKNELRHDPFPGTAEVLSFSDPNGVGIDLFRSWDFLSGNRSVAGVGPLKVGHVAFFSPDVRAMVSFYERILGFRVSDWLGDFFVFMRCNPDHHTVNFFRASRPRLHHIAFELKDFAHVQQSCETLSMHRVPLGWGPLRPQRRGLSSQSRRSRRGILLRARPDEERGARLFRASPVAHGQAATAPRLGSRQSRDRMGHAARARARATGSVNASRTYSGLRPMSLMTASQTPSSRRMNFSK